MADAIGQYCGIRITSEDKILKSLLEGSSTFGGLSLEGLFDIRVLQIIHQWIDFDLESRGEVFRRIFQFPL